MLRSLLLITLLIAVGSCDSDTPPSSSERKDIREINWLPGDTLLAAFVSFTDNGSGNFTKVLRIYDHEGNIRQEISLPNDPFASDLHFSQDGKRAIFNSNGNICMLDMTSQTTTVVLSSSSLISIAPDQDLLIIYRNTDNEDFNSKEIYKYARLQGPSLVLESFLEYTPSNASFLGNFPFLLAGGQTASLEFDSSGSGSLMKIRDSLLQIQHAFHIPMSLFFDNIFVPRADNSFFFITFGMSAQLNRFRTDNGFIDVVQQIADSYNPYTVLSTGEKVIFQPKTDPDFIIRDLLTGTETALPGMQNVQGLSVSHDDTKLAVVVDSDEGQKLIVITLP